MILILVILSFVLGCSFKCTGIKENFACNDQCKGHFDEFGAKETCLLTKNGVDICDSCPFMTCDNKKITENFTLGRRHLNKSRKHVADCIECLNNCEEAHCQANAGWCIQKVPGYQKKCEENLKN